MATLAGPLGTSFSQSGNRYVTGWKLDVGALVLVFPPRDNHPVIKCYQTPVGGFAFPHRKVVSTSSSPSFRSVGRASIRVVRRGIIGAEFFEGKHIRRAIDHGPRCVEPILRGRVQAPSIRAPVTIRRCICISGSRSSKEEKMTPARSSPAHSALRISTSSDSAATSMMSTLWRLGMGYYFIFRSD
ncbi:hypothetical protein B296_00040899 [Ensete ventricosum]|uniref:Uncharacterized protein n=1 Tax=Ensete ventricosum TaxID=4639 RepID=A0A426ZG73_ENSVE|nr:hypothetical protein B296_00040899 [Ensete ventricosum]